MPIEGLDSREQLVIVPDVDEHLGIVLDTLQLFKSEEGNGASADDQIACEWDIETRYLQYSSIDAKSCHI